MHSCMAFFLNGFHNVSENTAVFSDSFTFIILSSEDFFKITSHQMLYDLLMKWLVEDSLHIYQHYLGMLLDLESDDEFTESIYAWKWKLSR
jgi:hypothetical protein